MTTYYIIIASNEVYNVDFSQVKETSANTLRYNNDNTKTFVKFTGDIPSFVTNETIYTLSEFYEFTSDYNNGWCIDPELEEQV